MQERICKCLGSADERRGKESVGKMKSCLVILQRQVIKNKAEKQHAITIEKRKY